MNAIARVDILVDIGGAAANHATGFTVPSGSQVLNSAMKLEKALTGAGGAVQAGLGIGGTPDKYGETADLLAGSGVSISPGTWADGSDVVNIYAETGPGVAGGTIAGSGDEDARVVIYYVDGVAIP
jgi:hypothetical protein